MYGSCVCFHGNEKIQGLNILDIMHAKSLYKSSRNYDFESCKSSSIRSFYTIGSIYTARCFIVKSIPLHLSATNI